MSEEQDKLLEGIKTAIQMEIDGKAYYLKMGQNSPNKRGQELFKILAEEEDHHIKDFKKIYEKMQKKEPLPDDLIRNEEDSKLTTVFSQAIEEMEQDIHAPDTELEAIEVAIEMEKKSYNLYLERSKESIYKAEKKFYKALAAEEKKHKKILVDYRKYILDPAGWLVNKTFPSLGASYIPRSSGTISQLEW
jgi:rubrerythrin